MPNGRVFFKALNAFGGVVCVAIGFFLPEISAIYILQTPGEDAYRLIQAHWIAVGVISLFVSQSRRNSQFWASMLLVWLMLNGWLGWKALIVGDAKFVWALAFPVLAFLNFFQLIAQDEPAENVIPDLEAGLSSAQNDADIPPDFYKLPASSAGDALLGVVTIILAIALQIVMLVLLFFYGALMSQIIFEGASVDLAEIPEALGSAFWQILYIPVIIAVVYSIVFIMQIVVERLALNNGSDDRNDVNRALSLQERQFIEAHLKKIKRYLSEAEYPSYYGWLFWPSLALMIVLFLAFPLLVVWIESEFFDPVAASGVAVDAVISVLGPAFIGGVAFSFLFGALLYWSGLQWLGARFRRFGEYLHSRWGWNSMNSDARPIESYAKIFTRFVRKRRYPPDQDIEPRDFLYDAFNEFGGLSYKAAIALGVAAILFTALDVNWRRIAHTGGLHYSNYLDLRSHDLTLDDVVEVKLRCFLYMESDGGERNPGAGYDLVFNNGMRGYLLESDIDDALLGKVEIVDAELRARGVSFSRADRAGDLFLRGIEGYSSACAETIIPKFPPETQNRIAALLRANSQ